MRRHRLFEATTTVEWPLPPELGVLATRAVVARRRAAAEVELAQPWDVLLMAVGDLVEIVLHPCREVVVDQLGEVSLEQPDDGEGREGRDERRAPLAHVATVLNRADDAGVGRRPAD